MRAAPLGRLKYLQSATRDLSGAETRLSSGFKVARARDDAKSYHSAAIMRGQGGSLNAVALSLGPGQNRFRTRPSRRRNQISKLLIELKGTAAQAMSHGPLRHPARGVLAALHQPDDDAAELHPQRLVRRRQHSRRLEAQRRLLHRRCRGHPVADARRPQLHAGRAGHRRPAVATTALHNTQAAADTHACWTSRSPISATSSSRWAPSANASRRRRGSSRGSPMRWPPASAAWWIPICPPKAR